MCGIVAYRGKVPVETLKKLVYEAGARGLHNFGYKGNADKTAGIFHTRYITSGETNQPLHYKGRWMCFNGVINMGTKEEMEEEYGFKLDTDNDGEVMLKMCKDPFETVLFLKNTKATFAGVFLEGNSLVAIRNEGRPLWVHEEGETVIIASTKDIFLRAGIKHNLKELEPYTIYEWTI